MRNTLPRLIKGLLITFLISCSSSEDPTPMLSSLEITSSTGNVLVIGQITQLDITGFDQNNNRIDIPTVVTWSVDNGNVSLDQNGRVGAVSEGKSIITAEAMNITTTFQFTIESQVLTQIRINSPGGDLVDLNESLQLSVQGFDQINNPMTISSVVSWSSDNTNVNIDQNGLVTGVEVGSSVITAETDGLEGTFPLTIWDSSAPRTEVYVSDVGVNRNGPHQILKYDENGDNGEIFISSNLSRPQDIVFLEDQNMVIVSNLSTNNITKYDSNTGAYLGVFASGINGPTRVQIGADDLIYVVQWNGGPVKRFTQAGVFVDDFTDVSINEAIGIAWDGDGNLYVSSWGNGTNGFVRKFDTSGNTLGFFINSNLSGPTDIWFDNEGNMLVNDWSASNVKKFDSDGAFQGNFISGTGLIQPEGVAILNDNILIGSSGNGSVKMYDSEGTFIENLVAPGAAGLVTTNAVTVRLVNQ